MGGDNVRHGPLLRPAADPRRRDSCVRPDALPPRPPELHRSRRGDRVLHHAPVGEKATFDGDDAVWTQTSVAAVQQSETAAAVRDRVAAVPHRLGRRGHEGGVRAADEAGHDVSDRAHRRRRAVRRRHARSQLLHVSGRPGPRDDRGAERDAPQLHARASVQRRSGGGRGVVPNAPGADAAQRSSTTVRAFRGIPTGPSASLQLDDVTFFWYPTAHARALYGGQWKGRTRVRLQPRPRHRSRGRSAWTISTRRWPA